MTGKKYELLVSPILMLDGTYSFRRCSLCIAGQNTEASATCAAETK